MSPIFGLASRFVGTLVFAGQLVTRLGLKKRLTRGHHDRPIRVGHRSRFSGITLAQAAELARSVVRGQEEQAA
jgi:hypothetical protein